MKLLRRKEIIALIVPIIILLFFTGDYSLDKKPTRQLSPERIEMLAARIQLDSLVRSLSEEELDQLMLLTQTQVKDSLLQYLPVSELRLIVVCFPKEPDGSQVLNTQIIIPKCYLDTMVQSLINLHGPGGRGQDAEMIKVGEPHLDGPWWWTHPNLDVRGALKDGALIISWKNFVTVWQKPFSTRSRNNAA